MELGSVSLLVLPIPSLEGPSDAVIAGAFSVADIPRLYADLAGERTPWSDILSVLPGIVLTARPDGRIDYYNKQWKQYTGDKRFPSLASITAALDVVDSAAFLEEWRRGIAERSAFALHARLWRHSDGYRWQRFSAEPLLRDHVVIKWIILVTDVHDEIAARNAAESATQRLRFLSDAGRALYRSFDPKEVALIACQLATAQFGDAAALQFRHLDDTIVTREPADAATDEELERLLGDNAALGEDTAVEGGPAFATIDDRQYAAVELRARSGTLGRLVIALREHLERRDRDLIEDFGERVSVALDNACLYTNERRIATTLQSQLLPHALPQRCGLHIDAAYFPCQDEMRVGGDWYDAFELYDGRLAIAIGDVAGHGIMAAAMMGRLRHTVRAALFDGATPAKALALANDVVYGGEPELATAFVGVIDTVAMTLEWATAGHPPPFLVRGGEPVMIEGVGIALGVFEHSAFANERMQLPERGVLVLYTDGIVEYARDVIAGTNLLREELQKIGSDCAALDARKLARDVAGGSPHIDDAALLALCFEPVREIDMTLPALASRSEIGRRALLRFARAWNLSEERTADLVLASCEALNNAIEHAYGGRNGTVRIRAHNADGRLVVSIADLGRWSDRTPREDRGRGLRIIESLADDVEIKRENEGTSVFVTFGILAPEQEASRS